jgi:hypothetical protein
VVCVCMCVYGGETGRPRDTGGRCGKILRIEFYEIAISIIKPYPPRNPRKHDLAVCWLCDPAPWLTVLRICPFYEGF